MNVLNWLEENSMLWSDKLALVTENNRTTYKELFDLIDGFSNASLANGLRKGDRILIYASNREETVISILGTLKFGGIFVCINPQTPLMKLMEIIDDCNPSMVIADRSFDLDISEKKIIKMQFENSRCDDWICFKNWNCNKKINYETTDIEIAALIYTSGSTGKSKGVISYHHNIIFSTETINDYLKNDINDRILSFLPLSFDYGLYQLFLTFRFGATLYLFPTEYLISRLHMIIKNEEITCLPALRSFLSFFLIEQNFELKNLRYITTTGDLIPNTFIKQVTDKLPMTQLFIMYGLTECKRVSYLPPEFIKKKIGSVGIPLGGTRIRIVRPDGSECEFFESGELIVQGPHVCGGYWNRPEETSNMFKRDNDETLLFTGDIFYQDTDGFLYFVGRKDYLFKSIGYRIDPLEIESKVCENFTAKEEAVVVPIPDIIASNRIGLMILLKSNIEWGNYSYDIKYYCQQVLEPWKVPYYITTALNIPLTQSGKINRKEVAEMIAYELKAID